MKKVAVIITLLCSSFCFGQSINYIDLSEQLESVIIPVDGANDVQNHNMTLKSKAVSIVYNSCNQPQVKIINLSKSGVDYRYSTPIDSDAEAWSDTQITPIMGSGNSFMLSNRFGALSYSIFDSGEWRTIGNLPYKTLSGIVYLHRQKSGDLLAYFYGKSDLRSCTSAEKGNLYCCRSKDEGKHWSMPTLSLQHNLASFEDGAISSFYSYYSRSTERKLYSLNCSKADRTTYLAISDDDGESWSYPLKIDALTNCDNHILLSNGRTVAVIYRRVKTPLDNNRGDIFMALGKVSTILKNRGYLTLYKLIDTPYSNLKQPVSISACLINQQTIALSYSHNGKLRAGVINLKKLHSLE